ncbi:MAG TPA: hypothetical protein VN739_02520 [Nitrososphaerales archaeon]|nr:hypothetical protein [Nitrososphaerales archaeon]
MVKEGISAHMEMYDLLQCVDRALDAFGTNMKQAVYWTLMSKEAISSDRILSNPEAFVRALKEIFGNGYPLAERSIIKEMKKTFELNQPTSSYNILSAFEIVSNDITEVSECVITAQIR